MQMLAELSSLLLNTRAAASAQVGSTPGTGVVISVFVVGVVFDVVAFAHMSRRLLRVIAEMHFAFECCRKREASCALP